MSGYQLGADEILVHDEEEDDDMPERTIMAVDTFGKCQSLLLNVVFFICVICAHFGFLIHEQPVIERHLVLCGTSKYCTIAWTIENASEFERMIAITGTVDRAENATENDGSVSVVSTLAMNYTDSSGVSTLGNSGEVTLQFDFRKGSQTSDTTHIYTDLRHFYRLNAYNLSLANADASLQRVDVTVTRVPAHMSKVSAFISSTFLILIMTPFMIYRSQVKDGSPPECGIFSTSMVFLIAGSDIWQYIIPHTDPRATLFITRTSQVILVWIQRLIVYLVAKGRNVMQRQLISPFEIAFGAVAVMMDVARSILEVDYDFKYPFGEGTQLLEAIRVVSFLILLMWGVLVVFKWERSPFLYAFFFCVFVGYVLGLAIDGALGMFKDTLFRVYREVVLFVISFFLMAVTWPVAYHGTTTIHTNSRDTSRPFL